VAIDFEAEGLLQGTRGKAREARRELLEQLAADGVRLEDLRQAVEEDRLALLPVERVLNGEGRRFNAAEVAERGGVPEDFLRRNWLALGLPDPGTEKAFTERMSMRQSGSRLCETRAYLTTASWRCPA